MTLIVDASVAIKWCVEEEGADAAHALLKRQPLRAPDLIAAEVANALWKKSRRGEVAPEQLAFAFETSMRLIDELVSTKDLAERALELAAALDHPVYDCFYLALAEMRRETFITADKRLLSRLSQGGWTGTFEALY
jgi:predicted nucleic acid-binding protein